MLGSTCQRSVEFIEYGEHFSFTVWQNNLFDYFKFELGFDFYQVAVWLSKPDDMASLGGGHCS